MRLTIEVVPKIFPNLNVVAHLVAPGAGVLAVTFKKTTIGLVGEGHGHVLYISIIGLSVVLDEYQVKM